MGRARTFTAGQSAAARWQPDVAGGGPGDVSATGEERPEARERILAAAARLFYRQGLQATGVDRIIDEANVAKATFYRHFPSKDDLVLAWLRLPQTRWIDWVRPEVERRSSDPAERLLVFFDVLEEWFSNPEFGGCPFVNSAAEVHDHRHDVRREFFDHEQAVIAFLTITAAAAGFDRPERLAKHLFLVATGAFVVALAEASAAPAATAREFAAEILETARR